MHDTSASRDRRSRRRAACHGRERPRTDARSAARPVSEQADHPHRPIRSRQHHRHHFAHHCAASRTGAQPEHRHREQAGSERRHRRRLCRARRTRWLHAADEHQQPALGRAQPQQEHRLRSGKGLRAGLAHRKLHLDAGAASGCAGDVHSGADRLRQGPSRQAVVRERQRIRRGGRRNAQGLGRHQPRACALSKHAAGGQ